MIQFHCGQCVTGAQRDRQAKVKGFSKSYGRAMSCRCQPPWAPAEVSAAMIVQVLRTFYFKGEPPCLGHKRIS